MYLILPLLLTVGFAQAGRVKHAPKGKKGSPEKQSVQAGAAAMKCPSPKGGSPKARYSPPKDQKWFSSRKWIPLVGALTDAAVAGVDVLPPCGKRLDFDAAPKKPDFFETLKQRRSMPTPPGEAESVDAAAAASDENCFDELKAARRSGVISPDIAAEELVTDEDPFAN